MPEVRKRKRTLYVLYDAECKLCTSAVSRLRAVSRVRAELEFVPLQALETGTAEGGSADSAGGAGQAAAVPGSERLDRESLRAQLHVVQEDGAVYAGAEAVVRLMREMPGWRLLSPLYAVPGFKRAADALYRYVAKRRYDWFGTADGGGCADGACAIPAGGNKQRSQTTKNGDGGTMTDG